MALYVNSHVVTECCVVLLADIHRQRGGLGSKSGAASLIHSWPYGQKIAETIPTGDLAKLDDPLVSFSLHDDDLACLD